jgi:hypothetical protein
MIASYIFRIYLTKIAGYNLVLFQLIHKELDECFVLPAPMASSVSIRLL